LPETGISRNIVFDQIFTGGEEEGTVYRVVPRERGYSNTVKKKLTIFPSPAGMSLTKLCLAGNNGINPVQGEFLSALILSL
jgi:hypothetical protein